MNQEEASAQAQQEADALGHAIDVWQHVGGTNPAGTVAPRLNDFITRDPDRLPPPRWNMWKLVETVQPA